MTFDFQNFGTNKPTKTSNSFDFESFGVSEQPKVETKQSLADSIWSGLAGYGERVGQQFQEKANDVTNAIQQGATGVQQGGIQGGLDLARAGLRTVGAVASGAFAPITEAPVIKPLIEKSVSRAMNIPGVKELASGASELAKKYPNASKDIQNIIDIASLGGGAVAEKPLLQEGKAVLSDVAQGTNILLKPSEETVQKNVVNLFNKAIKPTSKKTLAQADRYENNVLNALKTIKANAGDLNIEDATGEIVSRTPQTIQELAQGVDQTKDLVFKKYDALAKQASGLGATIDAKPIADEVLKVAQNKALQISNPEVVKYAEDWAKRLKGFDVLDTETTQAVIKNLNNNLQAFYKNPTYESASKVAVDAGVANNFRLALDKAIEGTTGQEYQVLKNQYSALKDIENDVVRASMREAKKNVKGLLDYTDMFTGGQMVGGILSLNPAMFTKGAVERGFKEYIKFLNDPNRAISNIFDKLNTETASQFVPKSAVGKTIIK